MFPGGILLALLIAIVIWLATTSILWALIGFILVLVLAGGGFYSRRW